MTQKHTQELSHQIARIFGFVFSFGLMSTVLFFVLRFFGHIPAEWTFFHVIGIVVCVYLLGLVCKNVFQ